METNLVQKTADLVQMMVDSVPLLEMNLVQKTVVMVQKKVEMALWMVL